MSFLWLRHSRVSPWQGGSSPGCCRQGTKHGALFEQRCWRKTVSARLAGNPEGHRDPDARESLWHRPRAPPYSHRHSQYEDVATWRQFQHNLLFVKGIYRSPEDSPNEGSVTLSFLVFFAVFLNKLLDLLSVVWEIHDAHVTFVKRCYSSCQYFWITQVMIITQHSRWRFWNVTLLQISMEKFTILSFAITITWLAPQSRLAKYRNHNKSKWIFC